MAMDLVGREFNERVIGFKDIWLPAKAVVQRALESRFQVNKILCTVHNEDECVSLQKFNIKITHISTII